MRQVILYVLDTFFEDIFQHYSYGTNVIYISDVCVFHRRRREKPKQCVLYDFEGQLVII